MENENPSSSSSKSPFPTTEQEIAYRPEPEPEPETVRTYDVFLSFRGKDTRASFTSHLHTALQNAGITVFIDDNDLQRGDHISTSLSLVIERCQVSIIVFSINYADSRWCLDELEKIMVCRRSNRQVVVPVFYHIDPSQVRSQSGQFGIAFQRLLNKIEKEVDFDLYHERQMRWRMTLLHAANIAGFVILNRNESEDIKRIVDKVSHLLNKTDLFIAHNPVGIESRVQDVIQLLSIQSNGVLLLGMWGMGGIGKTTIAKAIYNKIGRDFEGRSFLANIRENGEKIAGLVGLQEQLLFDIFKETTIKIPNIQSGINTLQSKLGQKKVLIVLDDVNTLDQLKTFCGSHEWFGSGSIIIITTRDMHLLTGRVDNIYKMSIMNEAESIELFSWNAFKQASPTGDFVTISKNVVEYSGGLPLALEVLGSNLFNKTKLDWELVLEKLKRIPNSQVYKKLKISYDCLNDDDEQEIFLDIACFFIGMDRSDVILILNDCGLSAEIGINILVERSLVTVDNKNMIGMHDLLRDMGREIIREESPRVPQKRSRLWFQEDVIDILSRHREKKGVIGLALKLTSANAKSFSTKAFHKMKRLRLLQLVEVKLDGDFEYVSRDLRWLSWNGLRHIPTNFYRENLVSIELKNNNVDLRWNKTMRMEKLKILNLSHSHRLTQSPDFSNMPNLEKIVLKDCSMLCKLSSSIGHLNKILLIDLEDCIRLCSLPRSIYKLKSLKILNLSGCLKIENMEEEDKVQNTAITRVPFSVIRSKSIGYISLCGYGEFSRDLFPSILWSWMSPTNNLSSRFQTNAATSSLVTLDVPSSSSREASSFSYHLPWIRSIWMDCKSEDQLSLHSKIVLDALYATGSKDLESTASTSQASNSTTPTVIQCCSQMHVSGSKHYLKSHLIQMECQATNIQKEKILQILCCSQVHVSGSKHYFKSLLIQMGMNCQVTNILKEKVLQNMDVNGSGGCFLPGDSYPNWLTFNSEDSSVTFQVPHVKGHNLNAVMCIVYTSTPVDIASDGLKMVLVKNYTKATIQLYKRETLVSLEDEEGQRIVSSMEPGNKVEVVVVFENSFIVKKTSVYLIYDGPVDEKLDLYHVPDLRGIACSGDENEHSVKRISTEEESIDDFNRNRKKKNRLE
ncbi:disease resistance protein RUN1-like [Vicia villosa]|uniref:disease resistance protein RUN1-like n=1 Tax=Vicia villosa TaxID=3911 RepID=UPI00273AC567|nr:disease resistance protein RUN1-like [Vicia villosa]